MWTVEIIIYGFRIAASFWFVSEATGMSSGEDIFLIDFTLFLQLICES